MNTKNLHHITAAAIMLGVAFSSVPASADGRNPNDGGLVAPVAGSKPYVAPTTAKPVTPYYGRSANDGGLLPPSSGDQTTAAGLKSSAVQKPAAPHVGRAANDGGLITSN
jgi:hypothetical protein